MSHNSGSPEGGYPLWLVGENPLKRQQVLLLDSSINLVLGIILTSFPGELVRLLGIPPVAQSFYPSVLGAVLLGIGIALIIEYYRRPGGAVGLGLGGAVAINLCGGVVLVLWLLSGKLEIPLRGQVLLWILAIALIAISGVEILAHRRSERAVRRN